MHGIAVVFSFIDKLYIFVKYGSLEHNDLCKSVSVKEHRTASKTVDILHNKVTRVMSLESRVLETNNVLEHGENTIILFGNFNLHSYACFSFYSTAYYT